MFQSWMSRSRKSKVHVHKIAAKTRRRIPLSLERCEDRLPPGQLFGFVLDPVADLLASSSVDGALTAQPTPAVAQTEHGLLETSPVPQAGFDLRGLAAAPAAVATRAATTEEVTFTNAVLQGDDLFASPFTDQATPAPHHALLATTNAMTADQLGSQGVRLINPSDLTASAEHGGSAVQQDATDQAVRQLATLIDADATVTLTGTLQVLSTDDGKGGDAMIYSLLVGGREIPLIREGSLGSLMNGSLVTVQGRWAGNSLVTSLEQITVLQEPELDGPTTRGLQIRTVLVISFNFTDRPGTPWSMASVNNVFNNQIAPWYYDGSYAEMTIYAEPIGWYTLPTTSTTCNSSGWATMAQNAARADGWEPNSYNHVVFAFPNVPACGWSGLGQVPGRFTWLNQAMSHGVAAHELGHNLGLFHSHSRRCSTGPLDGTCTVDEYGDTFDVMGAASVRALHHASFRVGVNWLTTAEVTTVTPTLGAEYVEWITSAATWWGPRVLRVPRLGRTDSFYIEWREPVGADFVLSPYTALNNGVTVYLGSNYRDQSIIDWGYTTTTRTDAPVPYGEALIDYAGNLVIYPILREDGVSYIYVRYGI